RTKGLLSGSGRVEFHPERDPHGPNGLTIEHNFLPSVDWTSFFRALVLLFQPSYAMLHLFTERELAHASAGERFAFTGPISGEAHFTTWVSPLGAWRRPDSFALDERRRYRFLPELSWANVLGREFEGRFDPVELEKGAAQYEVSDGRTYF